MRATDRWAAKRTALREFPRPRKRWLPNGKEIPITQLVLCHLQRQVPHGFCHYLQPLNGVWVHLCPVQVHHDRVETTLSKENQRPGFDISSEVSEHLSISYFESIPTSNLVEYWLLGPQSKLLATGPTRGGVNLHQIHLAVLPGDVEAQPLQSRFASSLLMLHPVRRAFPPA